MFTTKKLQTRFYPIALLTLGLLAQGAHAGPYQIILNPVGANPGGIIPPPRVVPSKEYSHELDRSSTAAGVQLDAQQNTMWDGSGGVADTFDYDGADRDDGRQVDAIAHVKDELFHPVIRNESALLFSTRSGDNVQGQGIDAGLPNAGCGAGDPVCVESTGGEIGTWAKWAEVDQHGGRNLDGLEVWGVEGTDNANRYSLFNDALGGCSIYNYVGGSCYAQQSAIAAYFSSIPSDLIDIDGLMVFDGGGSLGEFDHADDFLLFSLWPIAGTAGFNVGDAVYVARFGQPVSFLDHGGHLWDNDWTGRLYGQSLNVDALEAVSDIPEIDVGAGTGALTLLGGIMVLTNERRRRSQLN